MNNEVCEAAMGEGHEQWGSNFETENYQYCLMSHLENLDDIVMIHILNSIIWHPPPLPKNCACTVDLYISNKLLLIFWSNFFVFYCVLALMI